VHQPIPLLSSSRRTAGLERFADISPSSAFAKVFQVFQNARQSHLLWQRWLQSCKAAKERYGTR